MAKKSNRTAVTSAKLELCIGSYHAQQIGHTVVVFATGVHPTAGYEVFLEQSSVDVFPPQFGVWHKTPSGIVLQVVTPYSESTHFITSKPVKQVIVEDANGRHTVKVDQAARHILHHVNKSRRDGPFPMDKSPTKALLAMIAVSGSNDAWTNLKRVLTLWSKADGPGIGDKLSWLWAQNAGGQSYPNVGIPSLIKHLQGDSFFGPCPATGTLEAPQFLPGGKYDTVGDLLDKLDSCGS